MESGLVYVWWLVWLVNGSAAVEKKNEKINYLSAKCWVSVYMYVVARLARLARQWIKRMRNELFERKVLGVYMWWLVWLGSEQTSQTSQHV